MNNNFLTLNIKNFLKNGKEGEDELDWFFSSFSCNKNIDVENFLLKRSIEFTKKNQSITYIVLNPDTGIMLGYFTITIKPITVNAHTLSNTVKRKIARVSEQNEENGTYYLSAYLIAQLGKNFRNKEVKNMITGKQLLNLAIEKVKEIQYMAGGMVVFLETEDNKKLLNFYEKENGFKKFDTRNSDENHKLVQLLKVL